MYSVVSSCERDATGKVPRLVEHRRRRKVGVQRDLDALRGDRRSEARSEHNNDEQEKRARRQHTTRHGCCLFVLHCCMRRDFHRISAVGESKPESQLDSFRPVQVARNVHPSLVMDQTIPSNDLRDNLAAKCHCKLCNT